MLVKSFGNYYVFVITIAVNIAAFITGTTMSWSSPVLFKLQDPDPDDSPFGRKITDSELSWIGALPNLSGIFAPLLMGFMIDRFGRRICMFITGIPFLISYLILVFATEVWLYYLARILAGVGSVSTFAVIPLYVSEIADSKRRGLLTSSTTCYLITGLMFSYCVGPYTKLVVFNSILAVFPVILMVLVALLTPESPYHLINKGRLNEAREVLEAVRYSNDVEDELTAIQEDSVHMEQGSILDIFRTKMGVRGFLVGNGLFTFQQFSGINVLLTYTQDILSQSAGSLTGAQSSIIVGGVQVVTSVISPLLSDRIGRRPLMLFSMTGSAVFQVLFGTYFYLQDQNTDMSSFSWLPVVALVLFILCFNSGFGQLPPVITAEVLPVNVKSWGQALVTSGNFFVGFFLTFYFNDMINGVGLGEVFWLFGGICLIGVVFAYYLLPETNGKSLQEIQQS